MVLESRFELKTRGSKPLVIPFHHSKISKA
nr:MAG TPA: hypothetical protein [Caudoviricetes sp.]